MRCTVFLVGLGWLGGAAGPLTAAEYHVDAQAGDDGRSNEQAQNPQTPWATLPRAARAVAPGDTVLVRAGVYAAGARVEAKGTAEQPIVFRALGEVVIRQARQLPQTLQPVARMEGVWSIDDPGPVTAVFENPQTCRLLIEMYRPVSALAELDKKHGSPVFYHEATSKTLYLKPLEEPRDPNRKCLMVSRVGTALEAAGQHIAFEGFRVEYAVTAALLAGRHNTARGLWAYQCGDGIRPTGPGATVERCVVQACGSGIGTAPDCLVRNNTIYGTRAAGLGLSDTSTGTIVNNIVWAGGCSGPCLYVGGVPATGLVMDHNVWLKYQNYRGRLTIYWKGVYLTTLAELRQQGFGEHDLEVEPLFVSTDPGKLDLRLQTRAAGFVADSPCINAGTPAGTDIGAFPAVTPVPDQLVAVKTASGVRLTWTLAWRADTIIDGFHVYRQTADPQRFERIASVADPGARQFLDPAGQAGQTYRVTSYRPGGAIESQPSAAATAR